MLELTFISLYGQVRTLFSILINKGSSDYKIFGPSVTNLLSANMLCSLFAVSVVTFIVGSKCYCIYDHLNDLLSTELIITQNV